MNVGELIVKLTGIDPNTIVILSEDAEGNGFSPLQDLGEEQYEAETTWMGEVVEEATEDSVPCVVLWPVN